jgi:hypothetical protein
VSASSGRRPCPSDEILGEVQRASQKDERNGWRGPVAGKTAGVRLRRASDVAVMQTTDFGDRDDRAALRRLDWATVGGVLVEREMCASLTVVREVADQDAAQVPFTEDENMIQTLPPDRTDEALREGILAMGCAGP